MDGLTDGSATGHGSPVSLDGVRTPADFADRLDRLRKFAGPLSRRELERRGGKQLRRTKIGEVLGGELPHREFLLAFLSVCEVPEDEVEKWLRVWTRLMALPNPTTRRTEEPVVARAEYDRVTAEAHKLTAKLAAVRAERVTDTERATTTIAPNESVTRELRKLRDERDAANREARHLAERYDARAARLRTTEGALDEALARVRSLERDLAEARDEITNLTATVRRLEGDQKDPDQEVASRRESLVARTGPGERRTRYTQGDPSIFVVPTPAPRPVIDE